MIASGGKNRHVADRNFLPAAPVPVPISDKVMRDAIQPGGEWDAAICIVLNVFHRPLKDAGGEILRVMEVPRSIVDIVEDALEVTLVE